MLSGTVREMSLFSVRLCPQTLHCWRNSAFVPPAECPISRSFFTAWTLRSRRQTAHRLRGRSFGEVKRPHWRVGVEARVKLLSMSLALQILHSCPTCPTESARTHRWMHSFGLQHVCCWDAPPLRATSSGNLRRPAGRREWLESKESISTRSVDVVATTVRMLQSALPGSSASRRTPALDVSIQKRRHDSPDVHQESCVKVALGIHREEGVARFHREEDVARWSFQLHLEE